MERANGNLFIYYEGVEHNEEGRIFKGIRKKP